MVKRVIYGALLTCALALPLGCSGAESFCDAKCDCEGCSDSEYRHCLRDYDDDVARSEQRRCMPEFDEYAACVESFDGCRGRDFDEGCKFEKERWKDCVD